MGTEIWIPVCILALCVVSVVTDLLFWKIPNFWLYSWIAAGIGLRGIFQGPQVLPDVFLGIGLPVILLGIFFYFRMMGAGDIKLFSALGAFLGADSILRCMLCSFGVAAGMAALRILLDPRGRKRFVYLGKYLKRWIRSGVKIEYGIGKAGKMRMHLSIPILVGVLLKVAGVYQ